MPPCLENLKNLGGLYIFICIYYLFIQFSLEDMLIDFRDRERGSWRGKEGGKHWLPLPCPRPGIEPATSVCMLTGNQTHNLLICRMMLQPTEPHQQGLGLCMFKECESFRVLWLHLQNEKLQEKDFFNYE